MDSKAVSLFGKPEDAFSLGILTTEGAKEIATKINDYLMSWFYTAHPEAIDYPDAKKSLLIKASCPRFLSGDGKCVLNETVRGDDLYIVVDVGNYNCEYSMFGKKVPMSPDDHFQDLKRVICAVGGKAQRINVIMPILYGGRQHKRSARESLDCALALQELERMGVRNVITFDAHDPRVQNATPLMGFDNVMPYYQVLKALLRKVDDLILDKEHMMVVSPDEGAMSRNMYYASVLGIDLGMFYKRRDFSVIVNGRNPIVAHEYLGSSVNGKDVLVADDIIASGESMLKLAEDLKEQGAKRIFMFATYGMFTEGLEKFEKAYQDGLISGILTTNLTYRMPELLKKEWFIEVDMSKYIAYFILATHQNHSVTTILDPHAKIKSLLKDYREKHGQA
ncbi:MAG: phosphoribosylpyrophosphate synthetase [Clostridiales bacterium]|nr:MAG: phosphoribosylpyrophosphate synthetase [Clostridiales bacterium]